MIHSNLYAAYALLCGTGFIGIALYLLSPKLNKLLQSGGEKAFKAIFFLTVIGYSYWWAIFLN